MWSRRFLGAAALAAILSCPARAQIEDSGLEQVDPWGISYLGEDEPTLRTRMWRGAHADDLLALMETVRTSGLTPAEHMLLRRLALSPARAPGGTAQDSLLAERARIAFELGEAIAAAGQMARLKVAPIGTDPAVTAADLNLVLGNEASACDMLNQPDLEGEYWAKLRAVCAALAGNTSGAELAMEIAQAQGVNDPWLASAIFAASGITPNPPEARFDSGLNFAISSRANLDVAADAVPEGRPELAAAMARRKLMPPAVRVKAAGLAAEAGLLTPEEYRTAYNSALAADGFTPSTSLDKAIFLASDSFVATEEKSQAIAEALTDASASPARFAAVSGLMLADIARLPAGPETASNALIFARASLAAGDVSEATRWITPPQPEVTTVEVAEVTAGDAPAETASEEAAAGSPAVEPVIETRDGEPAAGSSDVEAQAPSEDRPTIVLTDSPSDATDPEETAERPVPEPLLPDFETVWIGALVVLADARAESDVVDEAARKLMLAAKTEEERRKAARVFALWTGAGTAPPSDARAWLAAEDATDTAAEVLPEALAVLASARSGTAAETILRTLALTDGDPSALDLADLMLLLTALHDIGADDAARRLALEASGYWRLP